MFMHEDLVLENPGLTKLMDGYLDKTNVCLINAKLSDDAYTARCSLYLVHLLQLIGLPASALVLRHQDPHQTLPQHILPANPRMYLVE